MSTQPTFSHIPERTIGRRLRDAREDTGMSQARFAEVTGIAQRSISRYEQATELDEVKRPILLSWAFATSVPMAWLETGQAPHEGGPDDAVAGTGFEPVTSGLPARSNVVAMRRAA
jgi:transcriptional regulator with XRE-family HTH domain